MSDRSIAKAPFDDRSANIILRSCDDIEFYVYKDILVVASPFFRTTFSLPQPSPSPDTASDINADGLPIIRVPEDGETLDYILRVCYPLRPPARLTSMSLAEKVLEAALKYEIDKVIDQGKEEILSLGSEEPMRLYAFACRVSLEQEAKSAAEILRKSHPSQVHTPARSTGNVETWRGLGQVDQDFVRVATKIYSDGFRWIPASWLFRLLRFICFEEVQTFCHGSSAFNSMSSTLTEPHQADTILNHSPVTPFGPELKIEEQADIILQSSDNINIFAHKVILRTASAHAMVDRSKEDGSPTRDGIPMVSLPYSGKTLKRLVGMCYSPGKAVKNGDTAEDDLRVWHAAKENGMLGVAAAARESWTAHVEATPLSAYFVAATNGWEPEARAAARHLAVNCISVANNCVDEMEKYGTAKYYYDLLSFHDKLFQAEQKLLKSGQTPIPYSPTDDQWCDPWYGSTRSIAPAIALRAMRALFQTITGLESESSDIETQVARFHIAPAECIRHMVEESEVLQKKRDEAILTIKMG
ncbi:unnamed protein product [Somion occarium]|uniref:BTB domain-containing protein n=1 Tax=Somion occarium TaxID=3059160 RepID=A0ABP1CRZ8_9APHY